MNQKPIDQKPIDDETLWGVPQADRENGGGGFCMERQTSCIAFVEGACQVDGECLDEIIAGTCDD